MDTEGMGQGLREQCGLATVDTLEENIASAIVEVQSLVADHAEGDSAPSLRQYEDVAEPLREALSLVRMLRDEIAGYVAGRKEGASS